LASRSCIAGPLTDATDSFNDNHLETSESHEASDTPDIYPQNAAVRPASQGDQY
jgi:hypothetical protein